MSSHLLWKAYYERDVDTFRQLLETSTYTSQRLPSRTGISGSTPVKTNVGGNSFIGSPPTNLGTSPVLSLKSRKATNHGSPSNAPHVAISSTRAQLNARDSSGLTLLHHVVSGTTDEALEMARPLIDHPLIDLYVQDLENGWTALHRAFYFGNISIARLLLERDTVDTHGRIVGHSHPANGLVKVKDHEGNGPLDLYAATIKDRTLRPNYDDRARRTSTGSEEERPVVMRGDDEDDEAARADIPFLNVDGDQLYTFGSNQNLSLGFGDEDDRQYPERITLRRPEHLVRRFWQEHIERNERKWAAHDPTYRRGARPMDPNLWVQDIPWVVRSKPQHIQDVQMAKLSTAVITSDPESNLYMCGHGKGGRLGVGDEQTQFNFVCVETGALSGKCVASVALGQFHTLALTEQGEIMSWGNNRFGQLGYVLPKTTITDEDPISTVPRQIFGVLKRESVIGIAASRIHSVAYTSSSLYTFGKNEGQLGIVDSDARSLQVQSTPRKVAASLFTSAILSATAIDRATVCLLENNDVWVFANYGYLKVVFPLDGFSNYFLKSTLPATSYDKVSNHIVKVVGGGDTICAMASRGEIYTISIKERQEPQQQASTTNPAKIRSAITQPQRIWSPRKANMAAKDVGVDADGSIILSTEEGSVWKRTKRATIKDTGAIGSTKDLKSKDFKFARIPGLTRVLAVRASSYGAYAAVRRDCDVLKTQIVIDEPSLRKDLFSLLSLRHMTASISQVELENDTPRFWQPRRSPDQSQVLKKTILQSEDIEMDMQDLYRLMDDPSQKYDTLLSTSTSDISIPIHRFVLTGRSKAFRRGFRDLCQTSTFTIAETAVSEMTPNGHTTVKFQGIDILTLVNLVLYLHTDQVVDFWHMTRAAPNMAYRYRQIRVELMRVAAKLDLVKLEPAVRQMVQPLPCLDLDMEVAFTDPALFHDGDIVVQLEDDEVRVHSALVCTRCPFFDGLFMGRAGGRWLTGRGVEEDIHIDLSHISETTFSLVLRHIYTDAGSEIFDDVVSIGVDDFIDTVMDVMSAANELMLDRLSQICQFVIGQYVNVRNACGLLNAISPSSVHEFKDAGLEYLGLSLEAMLQGHHLNELDEELLLELDHVVRENQLACMPFAKSGRAEALLHERHPSLAGVLDRNRQAKMDAAALRIKFQGISNMALSNRDDEHLQSPSNHKTRRRSSATQNTKSDSTRSQLKSKPSSKDMMFAMDEESDSEIGSPNPSPAIQPMRTLLDLGHRPSSPSDEVWFDSRGRVLPSPRLEPQRSSIGVNVTPLTPRSPNSQGRTPSNAGAPWILSPTSSQKSDMKHIMAQTAVSRTSSLTQGIAAAESASPEAPGSFSLGTPKMSQKERKRLQHAQSSPRVGQQSGLLSPEPFSLDSRKSKNPWQSVSSTPVTNFQSLMGGAASSPTSAGTRASTTHLTMRQTVANVNRPPTLSPGVAERKEKQKSDEAPATLPSKSARPQSNRGVSAQVTQIAASSNSRPIPQSIRHQPQMETILGLSMSEILEQQELEKAVIKEATAKRDLQEIQAEQEFQEWWEKESARVQEAERHTVAAAVAASKGNKRSHYKSGKAGAKNGGRGERAGKDNKIVTGPSRKNHNASTHPSADTTKST